MLASPGEGHGAHGVTSQTLWKGVNTWDSVPAWVRTEPGSCTSVPQCHLSSISFAGQVRADAPIAGGGVGGHIGVGVHRRRTEIDRGSRGTTVSRRHRCVTRNDPPVSRRRVSRATRS